MPTEKVFLYVLSACSSIAHILYFIFLTLSLSHSVWITRTLKMLSKNGTHSSMQFFYLYTVRVFILEGPGQGERERERKRNKLLEPGQVNKGKKSNSMGGEVWRCLMIWIHECLCAFIVLLYVQRRPWRCMDYLWKVHTIRLCYRWGWGTIHVMPGRKWEIIRFSLFLSLCSKLFKRQAGRRFKTRHQVLYADILRHEK